MIHFNWLQNLPFTTHDNLHIVTFVVVSFLAILIGIKARVSLGSGEVAIMPAQRFSVRAIFEAVIELITSLSDLVIGHDGRKFVPMFATLFFFVILNNMVGLIPGMTPATDNINTTCAMGLVIFVVYNMYGIKENGMTYLKHFLGPVLLLAPLILPIELLSHAFRPLTLGLRLQGNMTADHMVLGAFIELTPYVIPTVFYFLGLFVSFMQAFVFTMLTMIYISLSIAHEH
jgi:F-type H+-transporting ATPase subunit a